MFLFIVLIVCQDLLCTALPVAVVREHRMQDASRVSNEYGVLEVIKMRPKMIPRPLPHYLCSFKYSTVSTWQNSEAAGRTGDFGN